jgi:dethiobiotin synthase
MTGKACDKGVHSSSSKPIWLAGSPALQGFFVTGTDTDVGKTLIAAWLLAHLDALRLEPHYWKPVQAGRAPATDAETVASLAGIPPARILPEAYLLEQAIAPHEAARRAGIAIEMGQLVPPQADRLLVVEGVGGLLVPLTDEAYVIDLIEALRLPTILVARSTLGTINHTLLSLEALRRRGIVVAGVVMNGSEMPHNRAAIERYGRARVIAEIPWLESINRQALLSITPEIDVVQLAHVEVEA